MSLRMISDVLKPKDIGTHCPLCGRAFSRFPSDQEHIFPKWLQHHHNLWNLKLNIPNFIGKRYKSVKIQICTKCNGKTFGRLEGRLAPILTNVDPFEAARTLTDDELAFWLGKIFWLLIRKSHAFVDYRSQHLPQPERILPDDMLFGTLFLGMIERAFATRKNLVSCYADDPPIPEYFYGAPYSLYRYRIDPRDARMEGFDFIDNPMTLSVGFRTKTFGVICLFDGGQHQHFRSGYYSYLANEALHPTQFSELMARMIYDQLLRHKDSLKVTYYWNPAIHTVVSVSHAARSFDPYVPYSHDIELLASLIGRLTSHDPAQILLEDGKFVTCLHDKDGHFSRFAVTDDELAAARADPDQIMLGPANSAWRLSERGLAKEN